MSLVFEKPELAKKLTDILEQKSVVHKPEYRARLLPFEVKTFPLNLARLFPGYAGYILEIGSGWGEFTLENAAQNPDYLVIAMEKKRHRVMKCIRHQMQAKINNIRWMILDVDWYFENIFLPEQFSKIIINFPDPWPKKRHHKHRFIKPSLVKQLASLSRRGGILEYATDFWPYMESGLVTLERGEWKNTLRPLAVRSFIPGRPVSYFQMLKKEEGENTYFAVLQKV